MARPQRSALNSVTILAIGIVWQASDVDLAASHPATAQVETRDSLPQDFVRLQREKVAFHVEQHDAHLPHAAFQGQTPDEM